MPPAGTLVQVSSQHEQNAPPHHVKLVEGTCNVHVHSHAHAAAGACTDLPQG